MKEKSTKFKFFSNPYIGILSLTSLIIGIIALTLSILFYSAGRSNRTLKFYCHPVKTTIVKSGQEAPLEISYNGENIKGDITAIQIAIWNDGKLPIERSDILESVELKTDPKTPILSASIKKATRDVTNLAINTGYFEDGYIPITWRILEKNDGGVIQVILAGGQSVKLSIKGVIKGQKSIEELGPAVKVKDPQEQYESEIRSTKRLRRWIWILIVIPVIAYFILDLIFERSFKKAILAMKRDKKLYIGTVVSNFIIVIIIYGFILTLGKIVLPPFSF